MITREHGHCYHHRKQLVVNIKCVVDSFGFATRSMDDVVGLCNRVCTSGAYLDTFGMRINFPVCWYDDLTASVLLYLYVRDQISPHIDTGAKAKANYALNAFLEYYGAKRAPDPSCYSQLPCRPSYPVAFHQNVGLRWIAGKYAIGCTVSLSRGSMAAGTEFTLLFRIRKYLLRTDSTYVYP